MDHKYRVEDHRIQAEELERIAAKLEAIELDVVSSQRSHNALLGASRDLITDQYHRMVLRLDALTTLKHNGARIISITGNKDSDLAQISEVVLHVPVTHEAGPLGLAPTLSTTCQLAVGDGLAMALKADRGFTPEDFARYHPSGSLGRMLKEQKRT